MLESLRKSIEFMNSETVNPKLKDQALLSHFKTKERVQASIDPENKGLYLEMREG